MQRVQKFKESSDPPDCRRRLVLPLLHWYRTFARDLPWRHTRDPYGIWVSEVMLQQTQVATVIPYWSNWMRSFPNAKALSNASEESVLKAWEGLGYYKRARNLQRAARMLVQAHGSRFPQDFKTVLDLPGIGRYTAGAICSIAFDQPRPVLDGNVVRVLTRFFGIHSNPARATARQRLWKIAEKLVLTALPEGPGACGDFNQSLMELGATLCTPRLPACPECPLKDHCFARQHQLTDKLPRLLKRKPVRQRRFQAFVFQQDGLVLVRQRPEGGVNGLLWEFPNREITGSTAPPNDFLPPGIQCGPMERLGVLKHSITCFRITLEVTGMSVPVSARGRFEGEWVSRSRLDQLPLPGAHRKIAERFLTRRNNVSNPSETELKGAD